MAGEFMYYYSCKSDIVIRKYIMLPTCLGGKQKQIQIQKDAIAKPFISAATI